MKKNILIILLGLLGSLNSFSQENNTSENKINNDIIEYPYSASKQRENMIYDNMNNLKLGMNKKEVVQLLTLPDEINVTYTSNVTAKDTIGFSYVYIIERKQKDGSQNEKAERLIRIHFNTNNILLSAYAIRIPQFREIEKQLNNIIKTGTEFEKADNILMKYGAKKNVFSRKFTNPSMSYILPNNVGIIIIYDKQEGKNIIIEIQQCNKHEVAKDVRVWENVKYIKLNSGLN
jgi:hypothetical protein